MIKLILFDCDGPIIKREKYFSQRLKEERGIIVDTQDEKSFFRGDFLDCEVGKKDLKEVLPKWLKVWKWEGSVDDLLKYWFEGEATVDEPMKNYIINLREKGIKCFLSTNNEKYRTEYLRDVVGVGKFLDGVFSSCYLGYMKPQLQYWAGIYKNFPEIKKEEILILDDKPPAIESAKQFGFNALDYTNFDDFVQVMQKNYHAI